MPHTSRPAVYSLLLEHSPVRNDAPKLISAWRVHLPALRWNRARSIHFSYEVLALVHCSPTCDLCKLNVAFFVAGVDW